MKKLLSPLGGLLLALLGVMGTTSPRDATSHVAGWAIWLGIDRVPAILHSALADHVLQLVAVVALTILLSNWWHDRKAKLVRDVLPDSGADKDYRLSQRMERMANRLRHMRDREWWDNGDPNEQVLADLEAFAITLRKSGFNLPHPNGEPLDALNILINFFAQVGSMLRDGHAEEARLLANDFAERHPAGEEVS